ncbi:MAG: GNAT family N-acetyltransferase [Vagococcus sp.]|uniref:GNAT family N-acetyltransferase n=1 Tax=Vagococcus TaxID=2737 RepID=UPI002FCC39B6
MKDYQLTNNIKENKIWRKSFNELAELTFGINFEEWYQAGFWGDNYIAYALLDDEKVLANASITKSELVINEKTYQTIQIGTVMTAPDYQGKGLSRQLVERILIDYQNKVDFIYLFANETVLDFYPKFGFKRVDELLIKQKLTKKRTQKLGLTKVTFSEVQDKVKAIIKSADKSYLQSYLLDDTNLKLFYYGTVFSDEFYYIKELNVYLCFEIEENRLDLFDVLTNKSISIKAILDYLPLENITDICYHFDLKEKEGLFYEVAPCDEDALFTLGIDSEVLESVKLPFFNHA